MPDQSMYVMHMGRRMLRVLGGDGTDDPPADPPKEDPPADPPKDPPADPDADLLDGAKNRDAVSRALKAERDRAKSEKKRADDLAVKVKEFEDAHKSETEKLSEERDGLKGKIEPLEQENMKLRVALKKGVGAEHIHRLHGETEEELEQDADALLKLIKKPASGSFDGGARTERQPEIEPGLPRLAHAYSQNK